MITIKEEKLREGFTKHHLLGLPFDVVIHELNEIDEDQIHDHPFAFTTHIIGPQNGGYWERIYNIRATRIQHYKTGTWEPVYEDVFRPVGSAHRVEANTIHQIVGIPSKEVYTLILPEKKVQEWSLYDFRKDGIYKKQHNQLEWIKLY